MITAQLATIPGRERSVRQTIESLVDQVDRLKVMANNVTLADVFVLAEEYRGRNLTVHCTTNDKGDGEKFRDLQCYDGYIFTCDDDLIYPPDYVQTMIKKIEQYGRRAVITCHGRTFQKHRKIHSYYRDKLEGYRCLGTVEQDVQVDSGGTGVMAWHSDLWRPEMSWFKASNMADVFIAVEAKKRNIPIICIEHLGGWIQSTPEGHSGLWDKHVNDDELQTKYFNEIWP